MPLPRLEPRRRHLLPLLVLAALLGGATYARARLGLEWNLESVRSLVESLGAWGPVAFVVLLTFRMPLLLPSKLLLVAAGICFGGVGGTLYGTIGIALSGVLAFGFTRWLGAEAIRSQVPPQARRALQLAGGRGGAGLVGLATGYPIGPITAYHVGAALTAMPFLTFFLPMALGSAVRAGIYAWLGDVLVTGRPAEMALAAGVFLLAALPLAHPRVRQWLRAQLDEPPPDERTKNEAPKRPIDGGGEGPAAT